jgi:hypothetical protein
MVAARHPDHGAGSILLGTLPAKSGPTAGEEIKAANHDNSATATSAAAASTDTHKPPDPAQPVTHTIEYRAFDQSNLWTPPPKP